MATTLGSEASINFGKGYHLRPAGLDRPPLAGFPQLFLLDPDRNIIEINGAPQL